MIDTFHAGPAFPTPIQMDHLSETIHWHGMTLLDYFAAKAMQSLLAQNFDSEDQLGNVRRCPVYSADSIQSRATLAVMAYAIAEKMLHARCELLDRRLVDEV